MRSSIFFTLATTLAFLGASNAAAIPADADLIPTRSINDAPVKVRAAATCTATFTGSNHEGGGGIGQATVDYNVYGLTVSSGSSKLIDGLSLKANSEDGVDVTKSFGSGNSAEFTGSWSEIPIKWNSCQVKINGDTIAGTVGKTSVSTGTVSVTSCECTAEFACNV